MAGMPDGSQVSVVRAVAGVRPSTCRRTRHQTSSSPTIPSSTAARKVGSQAAGLSISSVHCAATSLSTLRSPLINRAVRAWQRNSVSGTCRSG